MVKKQNDDVFDGFTLGDLSSQLTPVTDDPTLPLQTDGIPVVDPDDIPVDDDPIDDSKDDPIVDDPKPDDDPVDDDPTDDDPTPDDDADDVDDDPNPTDLGEFEADVSKFFMDKMAGELGWSLDEKEKFDSVSDVVDYMEGIVAEASQPEYASEDVKVFDDFVRNGGNLRKFYEDVVSGTLDLEDFDMDVEENQRAIIREDLRNKGTSEKQISRKIDRWETSGTLADEAEDALPSVETYREKKSEKLLRDQKKAHTDAVEQQQKIVSDVQSYVKKLKDIRGVPISDIEKKKLINDAFRTDATGQTHYQKVYNENFVKNLVESVYFTTMGDTIVDKIQRKEKTNAAKNLKQKLKTSQSKRTKTKGNDKDLTVSDGLRLLSDQLV